MSGALKKAMHKAYKESGENAYFGNGFYLGVEYGKRISRVEHFLTELANDLGSGAILLDDYDQELVERLKKALGVENV